LDCVKVLLQLNAPLRPRTPEEDTPKELAVRYKQKEVVEILGKEERGEGVTGESRGKGLAERTEGRESLTVAVVVLFNLIDSAIRD